VTDLKEPRMYFIIEMRDADGQWDAAHFGFSKALWDTESNAEQAASNACKAYGISADKIRIMHVERLDNGSTLQ